MTLKRRCPYLLISLLALCLTESITAYGGFDRPSLAHRDLSASFIPETDKDQSAAANIPNKVGTKNAPVDGKDGMPHGGPFVKSQSEREEEEVSEMNEEEASTGQTPSRQSKDGVMNDPSRISPTDGTRGTEGGVSEKSKEKELQEENIPDPPKEAPPIPYSEQERINNLSDNVVESPQEPTHPSDGSLNSPSNDAGTQSDEKTPLQDSGFLPPASGNFADSQEGVIQPLHSLLLSFTMILFSEIGDKTFIVAALMAMRHPRMVVFSAAFAAMIVMTVLSAVLGHVLPTLIPKSVTSFLAAALFLVFGVKMLLEARGMSADDGVGEEMKEVEMELEEKEQQQRDSHRRRSSVTLYALESGRGMRKSRSSTTRPPSPPESPSSSVSSRNNSPSRGSFLANASVGFSNLLSLLLSPAWVQTFIMTFLGEWGDRSQIATIAMAAGQDYWWVVGGALGGHFVCTGAAVLGGAAVAGKVSMKVVTLGGAVAFLLFGLIYLVEAIY